MYTEILFFGGFSLAELLRSYLEFGMSAISVRQLKTLNGDLGEYAFDFAVVVFGVCPLPIFAPR